MKGVSVCGLVRMHAGGETVRAHDHGLRRFQASRHCELATPHIATPQMTPHSVARYRGPLIVAV